MSTLQLESTYLRLRPTGLIEQMPVDATFWPRLIAGELGDFHHEYLVTSHAFSSDWPNWERHPHGDEIVCLLSGKVTVVLEAANGQHTTVALRGVGSFAFVPRGTWHTAKVHEESAMLFITAGEGTEHRPA